MSAGTGPVCYRKVALAADVVFYLLAAALYRLVKHPRT